MPRLYDLSCTLSTKDFTSMKSLIINGLIHQNSSFKMGIVRFGSFSVTNFPFLKIRKLWGTLGVGNGSPWKKIQFSNTVHIPCPPCLLHISFFKVKLANGDGKVVYSMKSNCVVVLHNICTEFSIFRIQYLSVLCLCIMRITEV